MLPDAALQQVHGFHADGGIFLMGGGQQQALNIWFFHAALDDVRRVSSKAICTPPAPSGCTERTVEKTSSEGEVMEMRRWRRVRWW